MSRGWPVRWRSFTDFVEPTQSILQVPSLSVRLMSPLRCGTNVFTLEPLPLDLLSRRQRSTDFGVPRAGTGGDDPFRDAVAPTHILERADSITHISADLALLSAAVLLLF